MAETIATGFAAGVLSKGFISLFQKVVAPVNVLICLRRAVTQMGKDVEDLGNKIDEIKTELDQAQQRAKPRVNTWLEKAEELKERSESIGQQYEAHQQHKSYLGCCSKCLCRCKISKDIRNWNRTLAQLHSQRAQPDFPSSGQYGDPTPRTQIPIPITETCIVADAKRSEQREVAERLLTDENSNIQRIGIIGMGGVGKTRLLDTINNSEKVKTSFELIIKLTVSRNDISSLQKCVAERLSLGQLPDNSEGRRDMLRHGLKNRRYLLLLDDMWAADSWTRDRLQDLGVSLEDKTWKFVLTTRDEEVCAKMNVQQKIVVKPLLEEEGWQLFRSRAFGNEDGNVPQDIEPVARRFAQECKGLPLAINVVAAAVSHHTTLNEWEVALDQMQSLSEAFYDVHVGVDEQLFKRLRWSYDVLPHRLKTCFLYFAAYPEDEIINVSNVIDMWICEGLVEESGDSYLHDIGDLDIKHLAGRCLIEVLSHGYGGRIKEVKIHDILRDLAIRIAAEKEQRCCFKAGQSLKSFNFEEVVSKDCVKLSLMRNDLRCLPTTFPCRSLSVLLLNGNTNIEEVPERFLSDLSSLKVLDLSDTRITSLPPSIGNLKHLASLQLSKCASLRELPEAIGDLKELQFLNVTGCSQLRCLPERITELKHLRVLQMDWCDKLKHLPRGIKELVSLEILTMQRWCMIVLDFEKDANAEGASACLKDLQTLRRLRVFRGNIKSPVKEGFMANWSNMRELELAFMGGDGHNYLPQDMQVMKDMESFILRNCDVERVPHFPKLEYLWVDGCTQLKELPTEIPCLTHLTIMSCQKLQELELGKRFPKLERLILRHLTSLECVGAVGAASGCGSGGLGEGASPLPPMLKSLWVYKCWKLKRLSGGWDKLNHLEKISGTITWWNTILEWEDPNMKTLLENKCEFEWLAQ